MIPWQAGSYINEAESLAAVVALQALSPQLSGVEVLLFVDNRAAEGTLLKAYSKSRHLTVLAALFWQAVRYSKSAAWVGRVPSHLNVADGPSRDDPSVPRSLGATQLHPNLPAPGSWDKPPSSIRRMLH